MSIHVQLDQFEGPLGLLLYLIKKEEMDISNIQIHKITEQYLEYIRSMKDFDLEVAGEFVAMAATLILIKSKILLPQYNEDGELVEESEDPRKELVQRLLEYQKYQEASKTLYARPLLGRDVYSRGAREEYKEGVEEIILEENGLYQMIALYRTALLRMQKRVHKVYAKGQSIASRIMEIKDRLTPGRQVEMRELLVGEAEHTRTKLLITFLSLLELARLGFISVFQSNTYGDIYVDTKRNVERDVVARVQEYDQKSADQVASSWVQLAQTEASIMAGDAAPDKVATRVQQSSEQQLSFSDSGSRAFDLDQLSSDFDRALEAKENFRMSSGLSSQSVEDVAATDEEILAMEASMGLPVEPFAEETIVAVAETESVEVSGSETESVLAPQVESVMTALPFEDAVDSGFEGAAQTETELQTETATEAETSTDTDSVTGSLAVFAYEAPDEIESTIEASPHEELIEQFAEESSVVIAPDSTQEEESSAVITETDPNTISEPNRESHGEVET